MKFNVASIYSKVINPMKSLNFEEQIKCIKKMNSSFFLKTENEKIENFIFLNSSFLEFHAYLHLSRF